MPARFKFSPSLGKFGMYTVPTPTSTDDAPLTDPLNNMDRVIFHTDLRYSGVVATIDGNLVLPARYGNPPNFAVTRATHILSAHGRIGRPMIIGILRGLGAGGKDIPWVGSVPVQTFSFAGTYKLRQGTRWLTLGVNGANIVAYENTCASNNSGPPTTNDAISIQYQILILDRDLNSALPNSGQARMSVQDGEFVFNLSGQFLSSQQRLVKKALAGDGFAMSGGKTCTIRYNERNSGGGSIIKDTTGNWSIGSTLYSKVFTHIPADPLNAGPVSPIIQEIKV